MQMQAHWFQCLDNPHIWATVYDKFKHQDDCNPSLLKTTEELISNPQHHKQICICHGLYSIPGLLLRITPDGLLPIQDTIKETARND